MTNLRLAFAAAALLTAAACASTPVDPADHLIVPGKRIGVIELGLPLSLLLSAEGQPIRTAPIPNTTATTYTFSDGLTVGAEETVYWIITEDRTVPDGQRGRTWGGADRGAGGAGQAAVRGDAAGGDRVRLWRPVFRVGERGRARQARGGDRPPAALPPAQLETKH